jgi:hypothetical protein
MNKHELDRLARRELLVKLAAAGALGAGGLLGLVRGALAAGSLPATPGFRHIRGPVGVDDTRASVGLNIKPGQTVMTGGGGEAVYIIGPDAFLQREKTKIRFEESGGAQVMRILTGKVLSVFGRNKERPRNLQIATATATIGIRGTGCYLEAEETSTYFCLCYGEAELMPHADPKQKEVVKTQHHDHPVTIAASGSRLIAPAAVINHTDAELTMLENVVGRWPPFYGQGGKSY